MEPVDGGGSREEEGVHGGFWVEVVDGDKGVVVEDDLAGKGRGGRVGEVSAQSVTEGRGFLLVLVVMSSDRGFDGCWFC